MTIMTEYVRYKAVSVQETTDIIQYETQTRREVFWIINFKLFLMVNDTLNDFVYILYVISYFVQIFDLFTKVQLCAFIYFYGWGDYVDLFRDAFIKCFSIEEVINEV